MRPSLCRCPRSTRTCPESRILCETASATSKTGGEDAEKVFVDDVTHRLFEAVERRRKGGRARLPRTEQGAARRTGFERGTVGVYDLDYRWDRVRYLLWDLHRGLARA
jgi:hypothetical protein